MNASHYPSEKHERSVAQCEVENISSVIQLDEGPRCLSESVLPLRRRSLILFSFVYKFIRFGEVLISGIDRFNDVWVGGK